jgi:hypothetical protein
LFAGSVRAQKIISASADKETTFSHSLLQKYFQQHKPSAEVEKKSLHYGSISHNKKEEHFSNSGEEKDWSNFHYSYGKGESAHGSKGIKAKGSKSKGSSAKGKYYYGSKSTKTNAKGKGGGTSSNNGGKGEGKGSSGKTAAR